MHRIRFSNSGAIVKRPRPLAVSAQSTFGGREKNGARVRAVLTYGEINGNHFKNSALPPPLRVSALKSQLAPLRPHLRPPLRSSIIASA